jgi:penicillin-binding protein 1C
MTPEEAQRTSQRRLYSPDAAFLISHILADRESRSQTFGLENALATPFWSAVKTGTSKEMRDNWCIGYSRRYTVGVWVGNFSGEPMRDVSGATGAAPVWAEVMAWLHRNVPSLPPKPPVGLLARRVTFPRGVEPERAEWFLAGTEPQPVAQTLALEHPRILAPAQGTLIALDPDIPPSRQRIVFEARVLDGTTRWILDGADLGARQPLLTWKPIPGRHTLALADPDGTPLDTVTFEVRGNRRSRRPNLFEALE